MKLVNVEARNKQNSDFEICDRVIISKLKVGDIVKVIVEKTAEKKAERFWVKIVEIKKQGRGRKFIGAIDNVLCYDWDAGLGDKITLSKCNILDIIEC